MFGRRSVAILSTVVLLAVGCQFDPQDFAGNVALSTCNGLTATHGFGFNPATDPAAGRVHFTGGGADVIVVTGGPVVVHAGDGNDTICVLGGGSPSGVVTVIGGPGNDTALGNANTLCAAETRQGCDDRDPRTPIGEPFRWDSIWNMPIGAGAAYVPAGIGPSGQFGVYADEDILILEPNAPLVDVIAHDADWDPNRPRCSSIVSPTEVLMSNVPVPFDFSTDPGADGTPNSSAAILMPNGRTIRQTQPLHRCGPGGPVVSQYNFPNDDIRTGDGIPGAHGGSSMSSLGGAIRVGELVPGGRIDHALKVVIDSTQYTFFDANDPTPGFRWPATTADFGAEFGYGGTVPEVEMGSLLALRPTFSVAGLRTAPGRILAQSLIDYGGYVVDSAGWNVNYFATEWGPDGRVIDDFEGDWGFPFLTAQTSTCTAATDSCRWSKDMADIFAALHVVDNNSPNSVGGPGLRRQPCAPAFADGTGAPPTSCDLQGG